MKKLLLSLIALVSCLSLFTQDAMLIYRHNYPKPLFVALKDVTTISHSDTAQVLSLEEWNIQAQSLASDIDSIVFIESDTINSSDYAYFTCPDDHHPHMIDLGLPSGVLWSCCNVDASTPEEYGGYYAWGETEEKVAYDWSTYIHCDGSAETFHHIGDDIASTEYDVAHVKWGGLWSMPSLDQFWELELNCTTSWTNRNGVNGIAVTGPNGNSIFFPAGGDRREDDHNFEGSRGVYWTSTFIPNDCAYYYIMTDGDMYNDKGICSRGYTIRPVVSPPKPKDEYPVAEAIDLGLPSGTKWASWNVGASSSEEYGGYYAWGETETKDYYDWSTYTYYNSETGECVHIGDDIAGTEYDVAHVKWGGSWRMPSHEQQLELLDYCSWTWTNQNGVNGKLVTGPNGGTIFLPAAEGGYGGYWSSSFGPGFEFDAFSLYFDSVGWSWSSNYPRSYGFSVRAVSPSKPSDIITFADAAVKDICVANWDTNKDGELSYEEAAAVKSLGTVFNEKQGISSFNELQCFTGLTTIEEEAFRECSLKSVSIPKSVKTIGEKAFMQCPNLSEVTLPEGVTWIDEEAFAACALASITLPKSLIRIGEQAFEENPLISVTLPRNVAYLGNSDEDDLYGGVFDYCYSLIEVNVDESNETYASIERMLTTKDQKILLLYPNAKGNSCKVPEGIEQIHYKAFNDCKITSVTLPSTLKSFITEEKSNVGFGSCSDLRTVQVKMNVPFECGYYSFADETYSLGTLYVPQGTKTLYETTTGWSRFQNIIEEEENYWPVAEAIDLGLPSGTKWASWNVGASAPEQHGGYYAWGETEEKDYYDRITYKFYNSESGEYIHIGDDIAGTEYDVAHVKWGGSWRMPSIDQIKELMDHCTRTWTTQNGVIGTLVTGPNGATIFLPAAGERSYDDFIHGGEYGYYWSSSLNPDYVICAYDLDFRLYNWYWDDDARYNGLSVRPVCPSTHPSSSNITFADAAVKAICVANWDTNADGELSYDEAAAVKSLGTVFYEKQGISTFNELLYFKGLTIIEEEAFRECSLKSVVIPKNAKTVGEKAFMQCPNLSEVILPEGVTWIDEEAFSDCALTSIVLPESLVRLGEQALENNPLISIILPRNVAYLGNSDEDELYDGVFDFCYSLKEVNVDESNETYASIDGVLMTKDKKILLFYPYAKGDGYEVPEGIEQIHYKAFNECKNTSVTLPSTLKSFYTDEDEESYSSFSDNFDLRTVRAKMKVPFECGYYSFSSETYSSGTLYVPQGSKTLYETTTGWSRFQHIVEEDGNCPVAEAIDLGLPSGTKWASWNVGASAPEEYGGYYAWGETEEKDVYDWSTYIHCDGSRETCHHIGDDIAGTEYDVAHVKWGGKWRMPTSAQQDELRENCTREWTQQNGVNGIRLTGPNGNSIFLPAAGSR